MPEYNSENGLNINEGKWVRNRFFEVPIQQSQIIFFIFKFIKHVYYLNRDSYIELDIN